MEPLLKTKVTTAENSRPDPLDRANPLNRFDPQTEPNFIHAVLLSHNNRTIFADRAVAGTLCALLQRSTPTLVACLLPDHLHWLFRVPARQAPAQAISRFKVISTRWAWDLGITGQIWSRPYFSRPIRSPDALRKTGGRIVQAPVIHGYVQRAETWENTVARWELWP